MRASYRKGVEWIALNDDAYGAGSLNASDNVRYMISVALLADLFGKDTLTVAEAVVRLRRKHGVGQEDEDFDDGYGTV